MSQRVVSAAERVAARKALQAAEEEAVHTLQQISSRRREMPAVKIEKDYVFEGQDGKGADRQIWQPTRSTRQEDGHDRQSA